MTSNETAGSRGRPIRVGVSLPPVTVAMETADGQPESPPASRGRPLRVGQSLPPVTAVMEEVAPALVLRMNGDPAARADAVADVVLEVVAHDRATGGAGFVRDRSREPAQSDTFTLVLSPIGPVGPETEARLREVAKLVASSVVSADVIPAA
jgi:hypothetical protein